MESMNGIAKSPRAPFPTALSRQSGTKQREYFPGFRLQALDIAQNGKTRVWNNLEQSQMGPLNVQDVVLLNLSGRRRTLACQTAQAAAARRRWTSLTRSFRWNGLERMRASLGALL